MIRNDYDVWQCARCGRERLQRSVPHAPPVCCGTGMWWQRFEMGADYDVGEEGAE